MGKRLTEFSVQKLNRLSSKKQICCYGCGKVFRDLLEMYAQEPFVEKITRIVDGNSDIWGNGIKVGDRDVKIESPDIIANGELEGFVVLITAKKQDEIYQNICQMKEAKGFVCSKYPEVYYRISPLLLKLFTHFTNKHSILFNYGNDSHENAMAIVEYIKGSKYKSRYQVILLTEDKGCKHRYEDETICISEHAIREREKLGEVLRYCYYYGRAKYLFYENKRLYKVGKNQKLIYLNHGTIPLKNVKDVLRQPEELDYAVCPAQECAQIYIEQYGVPLEKQLYFMHPRVALLLKGNPNVREYLKFNGQVILWLPTFRSHKDGNRVDSDICDVQSWIFQEGEIYKLNQFLKEHNQLLLIKKHPCEKNDIITTDSYENIRVITDMELEKEGIVLQELLYETAALITDYSGIAFEYLFLNKPIGYVIKDIEKYHRGFAFSNPLDYMPGEKMDTIEECITFLENIYCGKDDYYHQRNELKIRLFGEVNPYTGAESLIKFINKINNE